jgi:hypothetical protein
VSGFSWDEVVCGEDVVLSGRYPHRESKYASFTAPKI